MKQTFLILSTFLLTACGDMGFDSDTDAGLTESNNSPTESFICGNNIQEFGEECDLNDDLIPCTNCRKSRKIFINTSKPLSGLEIGSQNLDEFCTNSATEAGINSEFTWKAWISKENENIKNVIYNSPGLYVSTNYTTVAYTFNDLIDGSINNAIILDQFAIQNYDVEIWTGTNIYGEVFENCDDWTNDSVNSNGTYGKSGMINGDWTDYGLGHCARSRFIYCVEDQYIER